MSALTSFQQIYSSVLCVNTGTGAVIMNGGEGASILVDVGNDPSVSLYQSNGQLVVYVVCHLIILA